MNNCKKREETYKKEFEATHECIERLSNEAIYEDKLIFDNQILEREIASMRKQITKMKM